MKFIKNKKLEKYITKDIINLLKKKGLYDLYYFNLEKCLSDQLKRDLNRQVDIPLVIGSFIWTESKEGYDFWRNIHEEACGLGLIYEYKTKFIKDLLYK